MTLPGVAGFQSAVASKLTLGRSATGTRPPRVLVDPFGDLVVGGEGAKRVGGGGSGGMVVNASLVSRHDKFAAAL
jgi:hypothetical protein